MFMLSFLLSLELLNNVHGDRHRYCAMEWILNWMGALD